MSAIDLTNTDVGNRLLICLYYIAFTVPKKDDNDDSDYEEPDLSCFQQESSRSLAVRNVSIQLLHACKFCFKLQLKHVANKPLKYSKPLFKEDELEVSCCDRAVPYRTKVP